MQNALPVALSAQLALETRLATIADNVANMNTPGHLATNVRFEAEVTRNGGPPVAFASAGEAILDTGRGTLDVTGAPLDFAVSGDGWFGIEIGGRTVMTRDGRFQLDADGALRTMEGHAVLGPDEAPVRLSPREGAPVAARDGTLVQGERIAGAIGLFTTERPPGPRIGNSGHLPGSPPVPAVDRPDVGLRQGMIEGSNVDPLGEMTALIEATRRFENVASLVQRADRTLSESLRTLASR